MKRLIEMKVAAAWMFAGVGVVTLIAAFLVSLSIQASATGQIQTERARNIRANCEDINARHDLAEEVIGLLTKLAYLRKTQPERRGEVDRLINRLAAAGTPSDAEPYLVQARTLTRTVPELPLDAAIGQSYTLAILNPIVPKRNCDALATEAVGG